MADFGKIRTKDRSFCPREFGKNGVKIGGRGCLEVYLQSCKDSEFTVTFDAIPKYSKNFETDLVPQGDYSQILCHKVTTHRSCATR